MNRRKSLVSRRQTKEKSRNTQMPRDNRSVTTHERQAVLLRLEALAQPFILTLMKEIKCV